MQKSFAPLMLIAPLFACPSDPDTTESGPTDGSTTDAPTTGGETGPTSEGPASQTGSSDESGSGSGSGGPMFAEPCTPVTLDASACDPEAASFTLESTNPYYPLTPGLTVILEGMDEDEGVLERVERTVLEETRTIAGVEVHVLEHRNYHDDEIYEVAYNFYVEASDGTVCYFGEDVEFYEGGELVNMDGTWRAGVDGAKPGVIMPAVPAVGDAYYQEVAPGNAEDQGRVSAIGETLTRGGTEFSDVVTIMDSNPIDDEEACEEERKHYAPGIGEIADVYLEYVSHTAP